jgi:hypothetical protein
MFDLSQLQPFDSENSHLLRLTINEADREFAWQQAQHHSNPISRYNAYLNGACLNAVLNWLSEWLAGEAFLQPSVWHRQDISSIWEVVNGTAIQIGGTRLVLIPSDEGDLEELCVPQEWVDIPNWSADYYLPVQVDLDGDEDECWVEVCGFATHRQLKDRGTYSAGDRTYALPTKELTESLVVMQITLGLNLQAEVSPLPTLSDMKATELLDNLSNLSVYSPRLTVPFEHWASFLANDKCRQKLYNQRVVISIVAAVGAPSVMIQSQANLLQRAKNYFQAGWQMTDEIIEKLGIFDPNLVFAVPGSEAYRYGGSSSQKGIPTLLDLLHDRNKGNQLRAADLLGRVEPGNAEAISALTNLVKTTQDDDVRCQAAVSLGKLDPENSAAGVRIGKIIELTIRLDTARVLLEITLLPEGSDRTNVYLRVLPVRSKTLPLNLEVFVLGEDGEVLWEEQADSDTNRFQNDFSGTIGDCFQVKVAYQEVSITEDFTI